MISPASPIIVYDTGVLLQATLNPNGPAERALREIHNPLWHALMSDRLRSEYEDILKRPELQERYPILQNERFIQAQLKRVDTFIERIPNPPERITYARDPKDAPVVNLVLHAQASFLISRDKDLLDLNEDPVFLRLCPAGRVVDPVAFVRATEQKHL